MDSNDVLAQAIDRLTSTLERMTNAMEEIRDHLESELAEDETAEGE